MFSVERRRGWLMVAVGVVVGAASAAGIVAANDGDPTPPPDPQAQSGDVPANSAGSSLDDRGPGLPADEAIDKVTAGVGKDVTIKATVSGPLEVHVSTPSLEGPGEVEATWTAGLALGALADLERTSQRSYGDVLGDTVIKADLPSGTVDLEGGHGLVAAGQVFAAQRDHRADDEIIASLTDSAARLDLKVVSIDVRHPLGPAPRIVLQQNGATDKPGWTVDELRDALAGNPVEYEGMYVEVRSPEGEPLLAAGTSYRTGLGGLWFAPGQDEVFGAKHGGAKVDPLSAPGP